MFVQDVKNMRSVRDRQLYADLKNSEVSSVSGDGFIKIEQMPMEFARDCIHPERF